MLNSIKLRLAQAKYKLVGFIAAGSLADGAFATGATIDLSSVTDLITAGTTALGVVAIAMVVFRYGPKIYHVLSRG